MQDAIIEILIMLAKTANMLVIIWFVIGLLFAFNVVSPSNDFLRQVNDSLSRLFEPVLRPIRKIMPNTGAIDFSPMVFIMLLWAVIMLLDGAKAT